MNNNKKHRTRGPLGGNHADVAQQVTRGPLGVSVRLGNFQASTPGSTGRNEITVRRRRNKVVVVLSPQLTAEIKKASKWLQKDGVELLKDKATDKGLDWLKDKGVDVLKDVIGGAVAPAVVTHEWAMAVIEKYRDMSAEWVKGRDPGAELQKSRFDALDKLMKDGGTIWNGAGGWYWVPDANYHPHTRSIERWWQNPAQPTNPSRDAGNNKADDRPEHFEALVIATATLNFAFGKIADAVAEGGEPGSKHKPSWAGKAAALAAAWLAKKAVETMLDKGAKGLAKKGAKSSKFPVITPKTAIDQCDSEYDGSSCVKKKGHAGHHQGVLGNEW